LSPNREGDIGGGNRRGVARLVGCGPGDNGEKKKRQKVKDGHPGRLGAKRGEPIVLGYSWGFSEGAVEGFITQWPMQEKEKTAALGTGGSGKNPHFGGTKNSYGRPIGPKSFGGYFVFGPWGPKARMV